MISINYFPMLHCSYNLKIQARAYPEPPRFLNIPAQPRPIGGPVHGPGAGPAHDEQCSGPGDDLDGLAESWRWPAAQDDSRSSLCACACIVRQERAYVFTVAIPLFLSIYVLCLWVRVGVGAGAVRPC